MRQDIDRQLALELHPGHVLHGKALKVMARRDGRDDVLFSDLSSDEVYLVHLTYSASQQSGIYPITQHFATIDDFIEFSQSDDAW
jgi:hypothetical protein